MDQPPEGAAPPVTAYPRSALDEYLASAQLEQRRLEHAIADARVRADRATLAAEQSEAITELLHSVLHDLRREFADRRLQVEAQAEGLVAAAREEAGRILAAARLRARPFDPGATPGEPATPGSAAPGGPTHETTAPVGGTPSAVSWSQPPHTNGGATLQPMSVAHEPSGATNVAPVVAPPDPTDDAGVPNNGGRRSAPPDAGDTRTIDLTAQEPARSRSGLAGRFRRGRRKDETPVSDPSSDEFLAYLRGALVDDAPLDESSERDDPVDSRWTS